MDTKQLHEFLVKHQDKGTTWLANETGRSARTIRDHLSRLRGKGLIKQHEEKQDQKKTGVEIRQDGAIIINWTNQTIITDLGEWDNYVCSLSTHNAIQRMYSNEYGGKGATQSEIA